MTERISGHRRVVVDEDGLSAGRQLRKQSIHNPALVLIRHLVQQKEAIYDVVSLATDVAGVGDRYPRLRIATELQPAEGRLERNNVNYVKTTVRTHALCKVAYHAAIDVGRLKDTLALSYLGESSLA
jgi:hypothetical protein